MALPQADGRAAPKRHGTICANRPLVWTLSQVRSTAPVNTPAISRPICFARSRARGIHKLWHVLGGAYNLPHAETHTVIMPYAMAYDLSAEAVVMSTIAKALRTNEAAIGLYDLLGWLGAKQTLRELGMPESEIEKVAVLATQNPSGIREGLSMSRSVNFSGRAWQASRRACLKLPLHTICFFAHGVPSIIFCAQKSSRDASSNLGPRAIDQGCRNALDRLGQRKIERDGGERPVYAAITQLGRIRMAGHLGNELVTGCEGEVVVDVRVTLDVDLRRELSVSRRRHHEVDMGRATAVATEQVEELLGRAIGRTGIAGRHDAAEPIAAVSVGDDRAT